MKPNLPTIAIAVFLLASALSHLATAAPTKKDFISQMGLAKLESLYVTIPETEISRAGSFLTVTWKTDSFDIVTTYEGDLTGPEIYSSQCLITWHGDLPMNRAWIESMFRIAAIPFVSDPFHDKWEAWWKTAFGQSGESATFGANRFSFESNPDRPTVFWLKVEPAK